MMCNILFCLLHYHVFIRKNIAFPSDLVLVLFPLIVVYLICSCMMLVCISDLILFCFE